MKKKRICFVMVFFVLMSTISFELPVYASSSKMEDAISWAISIANDNTHGYSQSNRWGPDYDCSSFVISALKNAGYDVGNATYTGNMKSNLITRGFTWIPWSQIGNVNNLQRGDILLNEVEHTEIYLGNGQNVGAHSNRGYPQSGDQTGTEVSVSGYYNHPWDGVLRETASQVYENPSLAGTYWGNVTDTTFRPVAVINNPETVRQVKFAVWTTSDQSDLKWYNANFNGVGGYFSDISFADFSNKLFLCHVYVYGYNGSVQSVEMENFDNYDYSKPSIEGVHWGNTTDTTFRPVIVISNPTSVKNVRFAVWTTSDQRDLKWYDANFNGIAAYFIDINYSDLESQRYFCHAYVYGKDGSTQSIALSNFDTYSSEGCFEKATDGVGCVAISGYAFDRSDLNENISVHCYLIDSEGNATFLGAALANQERADVNNKYSVGNMHGFGKVFTTSLSGTYTIEVSAINIGGGNAVTFLGSKVVNIKQPTIYFDSCGGTECKPINVINTENYGILPVTSRSGYIFDGWYTERVGGQIITDEESVLVTDDQTLFAHWIKKDCEHENTEIRNRKEATCIQEGYTGDTYCTDCGEKIAIGEEIVALGHLRTEVRDVKEVTCTESGYTGDTYCKDCGEKISAGTKVAALGHEYTSRVTKEPTIDNEGVRTYICTSCRHEYTEVIPKLGEEHKHANTKVRDAKAATCTESGYTGDTYCKDCGEKISVGTEIAALGHEYTSSITKEPTTDSEGVRTYICTRCGVEYTEVIPKLEEEHNHTNTEVRDAKEASCTELGYTGDTYCKDCGEKISAGEEIPALGHSYTSKVTKVATIISTGVRTYTCTGCGDQYTEVIPKLPIVVHEKGKKLTDTTNKVVFTVTKAGEVTTSVSTGKVTVTAGEVAYTKTTNTGVTTLTIPSTVKINGITYKVTSVAPNAFANNNKLTKVTIGSYIKTIGSKAFYKCAKLKTVKIGKNVTTIGTNAFYGCSKLDMVSMGAKVAAISDNAFYKCTALKAITIPVSVNKIGKQAFYGCKNLKTVTINTIKLSSSKVGSKAFTGIYANVTVKVPKSKYEVYKKLLKANGLGAKASIKK